MPDDSSDLLLELETRVHVAHDLAVMLVAFRTEDGWRADALVDECLDRLQRHLQLLTCTAEAMRRDQCSRAEHAVVELPGVAALNAHR
jgi:hypothetical protein